MRQVHTRYSDAFIRHQTKYALRHDEDGRLRFKYDRALLTTDLRSPEWLWEYLEQMICPTLIVHGTESDFLTPEVARKMAETMASGTVVDIAGAGHSAPGDNPAEFEAALRRFLTGGS